MSGTHTRIRLDRRLTDEAVPRCGPYKWPLPLLARLRALVHLANEAGARTNQTELLAALLLAATTDPDELKAQVETFRTSAVRQALVQDVPRQQLGFEARGPGRPRQT